MEHHLSEVDYRSEPVLQEEKQYHLQCKRGDIAPVALVPGSRSRARKIGEKFEGAERIADNRGLLTITGVFEGREFTVTSTGMGGPSASIAYEELINLGAKVLIRIGSMGGLQTDVKKGDVIIPYAAVRDDGVSSEYVSAEFPAVASPPVYRALSTSAEEMECRHHRGLNLTHAAFFSRSTAYFDAWAKKRVISVEMEGSALFVVAQLRGVWSGLIGTCFSSRAEQENGEDELDEPDRSDRLVREGVKSSVEIALRAGCKLYDSYGPEFD